MGMKKKHQRSQRYETLVITNNCTRPWRYFQACRNNSKGNEVVICYKVVIFFGFLWRCISFQRDARSKGYPKRFQCWIDHEKDREKNAALSLSCRHSWQQ